MSELKNKAGIAEAIAWLAALSDAVQDGELTIEQGEEIAAQAGTYVGELLKGNSVHGRNIQNMAFLANAFELTPTEGTIQ